MLLRVWHNLINTGISEKLSASESRYVKLVNRIAIIISLIALLVCLIMMIGIPERGFNLSRKLLILISVLFYSITVVNHFGYHLLAKWLISWLPAVIVLLLSFADKYFLSESTSIKDFFSFRFFMMAISIIPVLIFSTRNMLLMFLNLIPSFVGTIFFDFLHRPLGLSFNQLGYNDPHFYLLDIMIAFAYFGLVGFLLNQRAVADRFEEELHEKQTKLKEKNKELSHMNTFINDQNYEMNAQAEKLMENHEALLRAHQTIEKQKHLLEKQNLTLEAVVNEKTKDLSAVTEELQIRNNELRQFSHTLSHNLKSPVATFQGLLNLIDTKDLNSSNKELLKYLNDSVSKMQTVFSDMNQMLEIRNKLYNSIEDVNLQELMDNLHNHFYQELSINKISFQYDLSGVQTIRSNERLVNSILYHLISNAIKFRSESREPQINIHLKLNGSHHSFVVRDNGMGINLEKYREKLFFPYQQFHNQSSGKGLGLYLVKLQAESLGGQVSLQSEPDNFTEVEVKLKK